MSCTIPLLYNLYFLQHRLRPLLLLIIFFNFLVDLFFLMIRHFSISTTSARKHDVLNRLGRLLQKGNITRTPPKIDQSSELYQRVVRMSPDDLAIQNNFNHDRGLFAQDYGHYLDRNALINLLPDEVDITDMAQMRKVRDIYTSLDKLDADRNVHQKYYRLFLDTDDLMTLLSQEVNNIKGKFRLLRRGGQELDLSFNNMYVDPSISPHNLRYNVIGYDSLWSGLPLDHKKKENTDFPREFLADLQPFSTKVKLHKRDVDFMERDDESHHIVDTRDNGVPDDYRAEDAFGDRMSSVSEVETQMRQRNIGLIFVDSVDDYRILELELERNPRGFFPDVLMVEVQLLQTRLKNEIHEVMVGSKAADALYLMGDTGFRSSGFQLCNNQPNVFGHEGLDFRVEYPTKEFNEVPNYALVLNSLAQLNRLRAHLLRVFMVNIRDQIDILFRIKHRTDEAQRAYMSNLVADIDDIIRARLLPRFDTWDNKELYRNGKRIYQRNYDALVFSPYKNGAFKRIYWVGSKYSGGAKARAQWGKRARTARVARFEEISWY